ncbi:E3 ubiquitin-protein ligase SHPRH [Biomphalaria glabrata]|nr:E3 ubiquitin-protein ligase SHPRH [Biomphalaria glabrata]
MGKRKQNAPKFADKVKRQQLQWNMTDQMTSSNSFICDDDSLLQENVSGHSVSGACLATQQDDSNNVTNGTPLHALCVETFYQNLASCHSTLPIQQYDPCETDTNPKQLKFGQFRVQLLSRPNLAPLPDSLPEFTICWLYIGSQDNSMLYFEAEETNEPAVQQKKSKSRQSKFGVFWFVSLSVPVDVLTNLKHKAFVLKCSKFDSTLKEFNVDIFGTDSIIIKLSHPSESFRLKTPQLAVQKLMSHFFNISSPFSYEGIERSTGHDFFKLYESVMHLHKEKLSNDPSWLEEVSRVHHDCLKPTLRYYQKQSVAWMLRQEQRSQQNVQDTNDLHPLYCEVTLDGSTKLYYNKYGGSLIKDRPKAISSLPGGILADEMGLGKTVEVLCCMLLNSKPNVSLPDPLPVIEDSPSSSDENTRSPSHISLSETVISDAAAENSGDSQQTIITCQNSVDSACVAHEPVLSKPSSHIGDNGESKLSSNIIQTLDIHESQVFTVKDETLFLNSKETVDLTVNTDNETQSGNLLESYSSEDCVDEPSKEEVVHEQSTVQTDKFINCNLFVGSSETQNYNIKINVSSELLPGGAAEENGNKSRVISLKSFNPALVNNVNANESTNQVSLLRLALTSQAPTAGNDTLIQQKEKKKRKGYVEYVPVTDEDLSFFSTKPMAQKQFFECNCGQLDNEEETRKKGLHAVKCNLCGMSQHAECMNYDLHDPYRGEYLCPHCHALHTTIESGATLIVSPYSICHQWIEEIHKHIKEKTIRVFIYTGVSKLGYIQPQTLAQQDIVITTYDVLRKELDYVNLPHTNSETGRRFRHPKRFLATPSPLVAVEWWRICLDEAQMVECVTTKTAEMALKLKAVNRWCVTGTPLMRSVEDIYGLLLFLGVDPLMVHQWFRLLLWEPFCHGFQHPMHEALQKILWRTAKKDVIDQIDLPMQTEEINWLTFSPVEEHFYRRQYEIYLRNAYTYRSRAQRIQDHSIKLHSLDRKTINELLNPLFRLRQACCHPQIVRGEFLPLNKAMMTMDELLEHMTKKVKTECEEAHRQIVGSINGLAGLAILKGKLDVAVSKYRDVLRSVEEHKDQFRTDDLQQLHAMHNLAEVLDKKPEGVSPTLRDDTLRIQCTALIEKYMSKTKVNVTSSKEALDNVQLSLHDIKTKLQALDGDWWADIVDMTTQRGIETELICKVKDDLLRTSTSEGTIVDSFFTAKGLMYVIDSHLQSLTKAHKGLTSALEQLAKDSSQELVQQAAACCLRPVNEASKTCPFCVVDELFNEYESKLYLFVERGVTVSGDDNAMAYLVSTKRQGTWADSEGERALKSIHSFYRLHFETDVDIQEAANLQFKHLDTLKKEFKCLRSLWMSHREMISATDECDMAIERLRLRSNNEPETVTKIQNVIEEKDIFTHELKLSSDEIVAREELKKKQGQLIYLMNLAKKNQNGEESNPDTCPVCQFGLGFEWSVLLCGHCFCLRCIRTLIDRNLIGGHLMDRRLKCPLCRHLTPVRDIAYVTTRKTEKVNVKGSHSTKVQAVLECLIKIREQDPTAKSLVFSVWVSVLDILAAALAENKILYKSLHDLNYFQRNLSAFKTEESIQVLLLPLHSGANGLNLVEANHVLLVEPELNLEEEAQAISRIYRIGQTRQTKIHRFLVRGTIEEKIFHMVKSLRESSSEPGREDIELTVGHITSLLQQPGPEDEDDIEIEAGSSYMNNLAEGLVPELSGSTEDSSSDHNIAAGSSSST